MGLGGRDAPGRGEGALRRPARASRPASTPPGSRSARRSPRPSAVPLAHCAGGWRTPLLVFGAVSTVLAASLALADAQRAAARAASTCGRCGCRCGSPLAWRLVAAFFLMSSVFYGLNAWLPDAYVERGWSEGSAGALLAVLNTRHDPARVRRRLGRRPLWSRRDVARRRRDAAARRAARRRARCPARGWLWAVLLGVAIGPLFPLTMTLPLDAAERPAEVAALAGMMLGVGYTLSALVAAAARRDPRPDAAASTPCSGRSSASARAARRRRLLVQPGAARSRQAGVSGIDVDRDRLGVELDRRAALLVRAEAARLDAAERHVHLGARGLRVDVEQPRLRLVLEPRRGGEARREDRRRRARTRPRSRASAPRRASRSGRATSPARTPPRTRGTRRRATPSNTVGGIRYAVVVGALAAREHRAALALAALDRRRRSRRTASR